MKKTVLLFVLLNLFQHLSFSQNSKTDSLKVELQKATQDTTRLRIYLALGNTCERKDNLLYAEPAVKLADKLILQISNDKERKKVFGQKAIAYHFISAFYTAGKDADINKALEYNKKIIKIYEDINDVENLVPEIGDLAQFYLSIGDFPKALESVQNTLSISRKMNYKSGIAKCMLYFADIYRDKGENTQALENYQNALSILTEIKDTATLYNALAATGGFYYKVNNKEKALEYYHKVILLCTANKDLKNSEGVVYKWIGQVYRDDKDYTNSLLNYEKSLSMLESANDLWRVKDVLNDIGTLFYEQGRYAEALEYYYKSLKISDELKSTYSKALTQYHLALTYKMQKDYRAAKENNDLALNFLKTQFRVEDYSRSELLAAQIDSANGNGNGAFEHYKQFIILNNKLKGDEVRKAAEKEKYQNEYDKQKVEQNKKDALAKAESKKQKLIILFVALGLLFVLVFAGFIFRSLRIRNKQNKIIIEQKSIVENKQKEILDSIEYALRIQTAILPPQRLVKQYLENSFILYKPKDIVAGDFYWMETVNDLVLFAACDCTGHGVPGAMVSVVCHNALNRAVREFGLTQPAAILDKTAELVIENFSKSEEKIKDGMDISLCAYNSKTKTIQWAGANNALWLLQNGQLVETKADKQPIGMNDDKKPFTNHTFMLNNGDTIYLFTDGFADQFGGDKREKKLTRKGFKEQLLLIQDKSLQEQGIALDNFITCYRKEVEQVDDILVMGVKV